ncbi:MAG: PQQ-binding-like beta-propeller repeat protein [Planctomycetes bacterium]|nr:PQQ-binding-like beta-propeller repeat protein [Planctomycetota bacterium]
MKRDFGPAGVAHVAVALALAVAAVARPAAAQDPIEAHTDVQLNRIFVEAQKQLQAGDWREAIARWQSLVGGSAEADVVVRLPQKENLVGVRENARRELRRIPDEFAALYRELYGAEASAAFAAAAAEQDPAATLAAVRRYPLAAGAAENQASALASLFPRPDPLDTPGFGFPSASAAAAALANPGELLWSFSAVEPDNDYVTHRLVALHPVAFGDAVIVHSGDAVEAVRRANGVLLWSARGDPGSVRPPAAVAAIGPRAVKRGPSAPALLTTACGGGLVIAVLDATPGRPGDPGVGQPVVALDAKDGALLWTASGAKLTDKGLLYSAPLLVGRRVYLAALPEDAMGVKGLVPALVCLDAETGKLLWRTPVPYRRVPEATARGRGSLVRPTALGYSGGVVYFPTQRRTIAALDAASGEVLWCFDYGEGRVAGRAPTDDLGLVNPVLVRDGMVLAAPADSPHLLALAEATGRLAWSFARENWAHLLGERDGVVYLAGGAAAAVAVKTGVPRGAHIAGAAATVERGCLTAREVIACRQDGFARLSPDDGKAYAGPDGQGFTRYVLEGASGFGNVQVLPDLVLVAGGGRIWAFAQGGPAPAAAAGGGDVAGLIEQMGSRRWSERSAAYAALAALGPAAAEALEAATDHPDAEIAWRARLLLERVRGGERLVGER